MKTLSWVFNEDMTLAKAVDPQIEGLTWVATQVLSPVDYHLDRPVYIPSFYYTDKYGIELANALTPVEAAIWHLLHVEHVSMRLAVYACNDTRDRLFSWIPDHLMINRNGQML